MKTHESVGVTGERRVLPSGDWFRGPALGGNPVRRHLRFTLSGPARLRANTAFAVDGWMEMKVF